MKIKCGTTIFKTAKSKLSFEIFNSIKNVNADRWDNTAGRNLFLQTDYLNALEQSQLSGIAFRYALIYENKIPVAVCYFQLADLTSKELGSIIHLENYGEIISSIGNKINAALFGSKYASNILLVCGSLLISGEHGIACTDEKYFPDVFKILPEVINFISDEIENAGGRMIAVSVKDFYETHDALAGILTENNFHHLVIDPNMIVSIQPGWNTFEDYLNALSAKYRLRANNALKDLKGVEIKNLSLAEIENEKEAIEKLYQNVQKKAPVRIVKAGINYFQGLKKNLKEKFIVRAFYLDGKMIAFTTGFQHINILDAHFIGIDYHFNKTYQLYLNILYDFVGEAIKLKHEKLIYGRTALEIKSTAGAVPFPLFSYFRFSNRLINRLAKPFIPSSEQKWVQRNPFKQ